MAETSVGFSLSLINKTAFIFDHGKSLKFPVVILQLIFPTHKNSAVLWEHNNTSAFLYGKKYEVTNASHIQPSMV